MTATLEQAADRGTEPGARTQLPLDADSALTDLYTAQYRTLVRIAAVLLDDLGAAEEVVQDAYVKMHGAWRRIQRFEAAEAYLRTAVVNGARSRMRRRLVAARHRPKPMPDAPSAEHGALQRLEEARVVAALRTLPRRQRECLVLRYFADLSEAQIAAALSISAGAVKSHSSRGIAALRARLEGGA